MQTAWKLQLAYYFADADTASSAAQSDQGKEGTDLVDTHSDGTGMAQPSITSSSPCPHTVTSANQVETTASPQQSQAQSFLDPQ